MPYRDESYDLSVQFDTHHFNLSDDMKAGFEKDLELLADVVRNFPAATVHCEIVGHPRRGDCHVKMSLKLTRAQPFFTGERDVDVTPAFKRCVRKLVAKVTAYRKRLDDRHGAASRSVQEPTWVAAASPPSLDELDAAVRDGDYARFRSAIGVVYDDKLNARAGRWIERYPQATALLGGELLLSEVLEEIYLNAFDGWNRRPKPPETLGEWLERLIDPSIRALLEHAETERENVSYIQSLLEA